MPRELCMMHLSTLLLSLALAWTPARAVPPHLLVQDEGLFQSLLAVTDELHQSTSLGTWIYVRALNHIEVCDPTISCASCTSASFILSDRNRTLARTHGRG